MKCETCGAEAGVHVTEVNPTGVVVERHLCPECLKPQMGTGASEQLSHAMTDMVERLRNLAQQKKSGRSDALVESPYGQIPFAAPGSAKLDEQIRYLEVTADFIERHGRPPTDEEIPDPF